MPSLGWEITSYRAIFFPTSCVVPAHNITLHPRFQFIFLCWILKNYFSTKLSQYSTLSSMHLECPKDQKTENHYILQKFWLGIFAVASHSINNMNVLDLKIYGSIIETTIPNLCGLNFKTVWPLWPSLEKTLNFPF